jgi:hypothetical protein
MVVDQVIILKDLQAETILDKGAWVKDQEMTMETEFQEIMLQQTLKTELQMLWEMCQKVKIALSLEAIMELREAQSSLVMLTNKVMVKEAIKYIVMIQNVKIEISMYQSHLLTHLNYLQKLECWQVMMSLYISHLQISYPLLQTQQMEVLQWRT